MLKSKRSWATQPALVTQRLQVLPLRSVHTGELLAYALRNANHLKPWDPQRPPSFWEPSMFERGVQSWILACESGSMVRFVLKRLPVQSESQSGSRSGNHTDAQTASPIIGTVNFTNIVGRPFQACTLGYALDHAHTGQGLMQEALSAAIAFVQREHNMHRIMANHLPHNAASAKTLAALGFEREGYARDYLQIDGRWQDHVLTALTADHIAPQLA